MDEKLGLGSEGYGPKLLRQIVRLGAKAASFVDAADDIRELVEVAVSPSQVRRLVERIGAQWSRADDDDVQRFKRGELARQHRMVRPVALVSVDGGRIQVRDEGGPPGVAGQRWAEPKVACCVSQSSTESEADPQPDPPTKFTDPERVRKLTAELKARTGPAVGRTEKPDPKKKRKPKAAKAIARPQDLVRTVVATMAPVEPFGWKVAAEVHRRGLDLARRKAFVCDGQHCNWGIWELHFRAAGFVPILDFVHLLPYLHASSQTARGKGTAEAWALYLRRLRWAWSGRIGELLADLKAEADRLGPPPPGADEGDARVSAAAAFAYVNNNKDRMDYPRYRRLGLPTTSSRVESAIKQINKRMKGTEKFWHPRRADAVLEVRSAYLSGDGRPDRNWRRPRPHTRAAAHGALRKAS